jgi:hypothetical protein
MSGLDKNFKTLNGAEAINAVLGLGDGAFAAKELGQLNAVSHFIEQLSLLFSDDFNVTEENAQLLIESIYKFAINDINALAILQLIVKNSNLFMHNQIGTLELQLGGLVESCDKTIFQVFSHLPPNFLHTSRADRALELMNSGELVLADSINASPTHTGREGSKVDNADAKIPEAPKTPKVKPQPAQSKHLDQWKWMWIGRSFSNIASLFESVAKYFETKAQIAQAKGDTSFSLLVDKEVWKAKSNNPPHDAFYIISKTCTPSPEALKDNMAFVISKMPNYMEGSTCVLLHHENTTIPLNIECPKTTNVSSCTLSFKENGDGCVESPLAQEIFTVGVLAGYWNWISVQ